MRDMGLVILFSFSIILVGCSGLNSPISDTKESDEVAMKITDEWVTLDSTRAAKDILKAILVNKRLSGTKRLFIGAIQNRTSEAFFPIDELNSEIISEISLSTHLTLIDENIRAKILKDLTYLKDGSIELGEANDIGERTGAILLLYGSVSLKQIVQKGQKLKEYTISVKILDISSGNDIFSGYIKNYKQFESNLD